MALSPPLDFVTMCCCSPLSQRPHGHIIVMGERGSRGGEVSHHYPYPKWDLALHTGSRLLLELSGSSIVGGILVDSANQYFVCRASGG